jgi:hypothetical protein
MEAVVAKAQEPGVGGAAQQLVQALAQIPGWDEKNFQVGGSWLGSCCYHADMGAHLDPSAPSALRQWHAS